MNRPIPPKPAKAPDTGRPHASRSAPPTTPDLSRSLRQATGWPVAFGTIAIVVGSLDLVTMILALPMSIALVLLSAIMMNFPAESPSLINSSLPMWWIVVMLMIGTTLTVVRLATGAQVAKRSRIGVKRHTAWAIASIVFIIAASLINSAIAGEHDFLAIVLPCGGVAMMLSGMVVGVGPLFVAMLAPVLALLYPVCYLFWIRRLSIRQELASW